MKGQIRPLISFILAAIGVIIFITVLLPVLINLGNSPEDFQNSIFALLTVVIVFAASGMIKHGSSV